jgi:hypothetical protein
MLQKEVIAPRQRDEPRTGDTRRHLTPRLNRTDEIITDMHDERWHPHLDATAATTSSCVISAARSASFWRACRTRPGVAGFCFASLTYRQNVGSGKCEYRSRSGA